MDDKPRLDLGAIRWCGSPTTRLVDVGHVVIVLSVGLLFPGEPGGLQLDWKDWIAPFSGPSRIARFVRSRLPFFFRRTGLARWKSGVTSFRSRTFASQTRQNRKARLWMFEGTLKNLGKPRPLFHSIEIAVKFRGSLACPCQKIHIS